MSDTNPAIYVVNADETTVEEVEGCDYFHTRSEALAALAKELKQTAEQVELEAARQATREAQAAA